MHYACLSVGLFFDMRRMRTHVASKTVFPMAGETAIMGASRPLAGNKTQALTSSEFSL